MHGATVDCSKSMEVRYIRLYPESQNRTPNMTTPFTPLFSTCKSRATDIPRADTHRQVDPAQEQQPWHQLDEDWHQHSIAAAHQSSWAQRWRERQEGVSCPFHWAIRNKRFSSWCGERLDEGEPDESPDLQNDGSKAKKKPLREADKLLGNLWEQYWLITLNHPLTNFMDLAQAGRSFPEKTTSHPICTKLPNKRKNTATTTTINSSVPPQ